MYRLGGPIDSSNMEPMVRCRSTASMLVDRMHLGKNYLFGKEYYFEHSGIFTHAQ